VMELRSDFRGTMAAAAAATTTTGASIYASSYATATDRDQAAHE